MNALRVDDFVEPLDARWVDGVESADDRHWAEKESR